MFKPLVIGIGYMIPSKNRSKWLKKQFEFSGPTYIKIGQFIANRRDVFGTELSSEMENLQDNVSQVPWSRISPQVNLENFDSVDQVPIATASISQVHRGVYKGKQVAIKVKKPDIHRELASDIDTLKKYIKMFPSCERALIDFEGAIEKELDFENEILNIQNFSTIYEFSNTVEVPRVYTEACSSNVIVMNFLEKTKNVPNAESLINIFVDQLLYEGVIHGDLHSGNIGVGKDGKIILYDFGNVIHVPKSYRLNMRDFVYYMQMKNTKGVLATMKRMGMKIVDEKTTITFIDKFFTYIDTLDIKSFTFDPTEIQEKVPVVMDKTTFTLLRSYSLLEGYCKKIEPQFSYDNILRRALELLYLDSDYIVYRARKDLNMFTFNK